MKRLTAYANQMTTALNNALWGAESFFDPDPDYPERRHDDDGYPGDSITEFYESLRDTYGEDAFPGLPDPLPDYVIDTSVACRTGEVVPWTGVWYPSTGLEGHSLTFAIQGQRMQPVYCVIKTADQFMEEEVYCGPETVAVITTWHPLVPGVASDGARDLSTARCG